MTATALVMRDDRSRALYLVDPRRINTFPAQPLFERQALLNSSLVVPWGLRPGDFVTVSAGSGNRPTIAAVNGVGEPAVCRDRQDFVGGLRNHLGFPRLELPIDVNHDVEMRLIRALAPIGLGSEVIIEGPAGSGKTWTSQILARALLTCAARAQAIDPRQAAFVFLAVGERPPDVNKLKLVIGPTFGESCGMEAILFQGVDPFPGLHREIYYGFNTEASVLTANLALERVRRLVEHGRDVFFFVDSLWRLVLTLGGIKDDSPEGLAAAGVPQKALRYVKDSFLFAGVLPGGGSLTVIATCLFEPRSAAETVLNEIGAASATTRIRHRREEDPDVPRPWLDVGGVTGTRELECLLSPERLALHKELARRANSGRGPADKLAYLRQLFAATPFDEEALRRKWEVAKKPVTPEDRASSSVEFLAGKAAEVLGRITNPTKAAAAVLAMIRTGRSLTGSAEAVEWLVKALGEAEREALFALMTKAGLLPMVAETLAPPVGDPLQDLLSAADRLRNAGGDVHAAVKQALARLGLTPEQLIDQPAADLSGPVARMKALLDLVASQTDRKFKKRDRWAKELVERGFVTPENLEDEEALAGCEIYQRLKGKAGRPGETMESLLSAGPRLVGSKKR